MAFYHGLGWWEEPGQQGAHRALPVQYFLKRQFHVSILMIGSLTGVQVTSGNWDLNISEVPEGNQVWKNLFHLLQSLLRVIASCLTLQQALFNPNIVYISRSRRTS